MPGFSTSSFLTALRRGFLFYALSSLLIAAQFVGYIFGNPVLGDMDAEGWVFFVSSCVGHAAQVALVPFAVFVVFAAVRLPRVGTVLHVLLVILFCVVNHVNGMVYALYRFHINGFVLNMFFGDSAGDIFEFDTMVYAKVCLVFALLGGCVVGLWFLSAWLWRRRGEAFVVPFVVFFAASTLFSHGWHVYASFFRHQAVIRSERLIPYFFPLTAYGFMVRHGFDAPDAISASVSETASHGGGVRYPLRPFKAVRPDSLPNIVLILIDSWNRRALTEEGMPSAWAFAQENTWFTNHMSGSNGTTTAVFGIFFGVPGYYDEAFANAGVQPPLIGRMLELGYDVKVYPSASLLDPPFASTLFARVPNLTVQTQGETALERDVRLVGDFLQDLEERPDTAAPFFSFLFFDLPHNFRLPKELNQRFQPAWDFADYTSLDNDTDPTPFWNLYRNCCYQDDLLLGRIFEAMKAKGLWDNTVVILSGDHSQEFNENRRNFWGHNGNFSVHQIGVPMVCHFPGRAGAVKMSHRTTHYDIAPTLMSQYLGVRNDIADYSVGRLLTDTASRGWHVVGSNLNHAFIIEGDTILEKTPDGALDVYDARLNPVAGYRLPVGRFKEAVRQLNKYFN